MSPQRLMVAGYSHLSALSGFQFIDAVEYFDPDAVVLPDQRALMQFQSNYQDVLDDVSNIDIIALNQRIPSESPNIFHFNGIDVVIATTDDHLASIEILEHNGTLDTTTETYIISNHLDISIDLTSLSTTLNGIKSYKTALNPDSLQGSYTHLLTTASTNYRREWDGIAINGIMPQEKGSEFKLPSLHLHTDGTICTTDIRTSRLGLQALDEVGPTLAKRLHEADYHDRMTIAETNMRELLSIKGIGRAKAARLHNHATAFANETAVCDNDDRYFPDEEPLFIDIETDGLTPTIIWLIGVLNRDTRADDSSYMSFLQRDPDDAGSILESFMSWYAANAAPRPIVAYNGLEFDFPVLNEHIERYCPEYLDIWNNVYMFDPYAWAIHNNNALLPGRTNQLDDVADALGWDSDTSILSAEAVARIYRQWMNGGDSDSEPDWDRLEAYCEDDVRALAYVYDALDSARQTISSDETTTDTTTTQGKLTDF